MPSHAPQSQSACRSAAPVESTPVSGPPHPPGFSGKKKTDLTGLLTEFYSHSVNNPDGWGLASVDDSQSLIYKERVAAYKITNIENGMCYVGQAVNIADRWKQHIKRGIGAETPTRNKLYPAMLAFGVENFTFEIVEECEREKLNERELYWQEYFGAKEFGYSIK